MTTRPASLTDLAYRADLARERLFTALDGLDRDPHDPVQVQAVRGRWAEIKAVFRAQQRAEADAMNQLHADHLVLARAKRHPDRHPPAPRKNSPRTIRLEQERQRVLARNPDPVDAA